MDMSKIRDSWNGHNVKNYGIIRGNHWEELKTVFVIVITGISMEFLLQVSRLLALK